MSRPQNGASRLSEDIGDVLSAIRRLIAEDEALDFARARLEREKPATDPGEALAYRFGGEPALARRLVRDGRARREGAETGSTETGFTEHPLTAPRPRVVADLQVPPSRPAGAALVARREPAGRPEIAGRGEAGRLAPLWLSDSDRVDHAPATRPISGQRDADGKLCPPPARPVPPGAAGQRTNGGFEAEEEDRFSEPFAAKARMRPEPARPAAIRPEPARPEPAWAEPAQTDSATPIPAWLVTAEQADAAPTDFWSAYLQSESEPEVDRATIDAPDVIEPAVATEPATATEPAAATELLPQASLSMSIPVYPEEEASPEVQPPVAVENAQTAETEPVPPTPQDSIAETSPESDVSLEAGLQELIREIIQEELHGELGQRFSRNLRAVIRREVAAAIDDHLERL